LSALQNQDTAGFKRSIPFAIALRAKFTEPENVASVRMRPIHLEEIARRFPKITVLGAHCGNPEYQWAAEIARWNSNAFFDLSGSTLTKMKQRWPRSRRFSGGPVKASPKW
jgi:predicted TIM-barrel fold metal-dependent hydrolase